MKKLFVTALAMICSGVSFAGQIGEDGFIKVETI